MKRAYLKTFVFTFFLVLPFNLSFALNSPSLIKNFPLSPKLKVDIKSTKDIRRFLQGFLTFQKVDSQIVDTQYYLSIPLQESGEVLLLDSQQRILATTRLYTARSANNRQLTYTIFTFPETSESCIFAGTYFTNSQASRYSGDVYCRKHTPERMNADLQILINSREIHLQYNPEYYFNSTFHFAPSNSH